MRPRERQSEELARYPQMAFDAKEQPDADKSKNDQRQPYPSQKRHGGQDLMWHHAHDAGVPGVSGESISNDLNHVWEKRSNGPFELRLDLYSDYKDESKPVKPVSCSIS
jgi:hypothetical protein